MNQHLKPTKKAYDPNTPAVESSRRDFPGVIQELKRALSGGIPLRNSWVRAVTLGRIVAQWVLMTRDIHGKERAVSQAVKAMNITRTKDAKAWSEKNLPSFELLVAALDWKERDKESNPGVFKIAPFVVHDAVGLNETKRKAVQALVETTVRELKGSKFAQVLYGDINIVGNITKSNTLAWYNYSSDDVFLRPETKFGPGDVRSLIHELGHRYWYKFCPKEAQRNWESHYIHLRYSRTPFKPLKAGDTINLPIRGSSNTPPVVKEVTWDKILLESGGYLSRSAVEKILRAKSSFPTEYSATSEKEYFAEAFSYYVLGKLDSPFKEHFERIVLEGGPAKEEISLSKSAQFVAGVYRVAAKHVFKIALETKSWGGLTFKIDRPKGFKKEWTNEDGSVKEYVYPVDYGYFTDHTGEDEEGLDAFIGDDPEGRIESFLKMKPSEDGKTLVPDETKFLIGLTDEEREKVLALYDPKNIVGLREYEDVYELVATLNAFRDEE